VSEIFPTAVYLLCFLTSSTCAWLLVRNYNRTRVRLLLWSSACFVLLAANNLVVILDMLIIQSIDFRIHRLVLSLAAIGILLCGLIWDVEEDRG
jgi:hypothetical protein